MGLKTAQAQQAGIDKTEGDNGRGKGFGDEEQRKLAYEIAVTGLADRSRVALGRQKCPADDQLVAEIIEFLGFGFEMAIVQVRQNKIQNRQLGAEMLDGTLAAIAEAFATAV